MAKEMKVIVISGFLGAGKTTFIKTMVRRTGKSFCILENEYAGSSVDTTVLEGEDDINVWEMTEGCICCTMKSSFANKIMNISQLLDPDYLIVEATGIGYLSRIISNIQTVEYERIRLMQAVTVVDAASVQNRKFAEDELYRDQVKSAQVIVMSKGESWTGEELSEAEAILREYNPEALIVTKHYSTMQDDFWSGLLTRYFDGHAAEAPKEEEDRWESLTLNDIVIPDFTELLIFMRELLDGRYGRVIRSKGFAECDGQWLLCDISGERWSVLGTSPQEKSNFIFIGEDLDREGIRRHFVQMNLRKMRIRLRDRSGDRRPSNTALL